MSQKRHKKRKPQGPKATQNPMELQQTEKRKKFNPAARNLLWLDLIFLAVCQILVDQEMITEAMANFTTLLGVVLLCVALWLQFGPKDKGPKAPR